MALVSCVTLWPSVVLAQERSVDAGAPIDATALNAGDAEVARVGDAALLDAGADAARGDAAFVDAAVDADASTDAALADAAPADAATATVVIVKPVLSQPPASPDADFLGDVMRLLSAEQEHDAESLANPKEPGTDADLERLLPAMPASTFSLFGSLVLLVLTLLALAGTRRLRESLSADGILPSALTVLHRVLQFVLLVTVFAIAVRLLPSSLEPASRFLLLAVALAIGWSTRDILTDIVAGLVLTFERRVARDVWVKGDDFEGLVERRTLRALWLRDGQGNRISVPNRKVLRSTVVVQESSGAIHDVSLSVGREHRTNDIRRALRDATIASPWVRPGVVPIIRQDGRAPELWHIRTALLEMRFAGLFEGDILERVEEVLEKYAARTAVVEEEVDVGS
jgi:hypothetical protein